MYKVFINDKPFEVVHFNHPIEMIDGTLVMTYNNPADIIETIGLMEREPLLRRVFMICEDPATLFEEVKKNSK